MMFDGPIFADEDDVKNGWVNVGIYKDCQSLGLCWGTREAAVMNAGHRIAYRIHVKVKTSHMVLTPMSGIIRGGE